MPVVLRHRGYRFQFYANEGNPREPAHVHVVKDGIDVKFWLWPEVRLAYNDGMSAQAIRELTEVVGRHRDEIQRKWDDFFGEAD